MRKFFMEYELNTMKADHMFESAFDTFAIKGAQIMYLESSMDEDTQNDYLIQEAGKFVQAVKKFFQKLIDNARKLIHDISVKFAVDMESRKVNAKLKELKAKLAQEDYQYAASQKVECFNLKGYTKAYSQYINECVAQAKKLYSKEYDTVDEYNAAFEKMGEALTKKLEELKLDKYDSYVLEVGVVDAIRYTEDELKSMVSVTRAYEKAWTDAIKEYEKMATSTDNATAVSDIKAECSSLNTHCSQGIKNIISSPIKKLSNILKVFKKKDAE